MLGGRSHATFPSRLLPLPSDYYPASLGARPFVCLRALCLSPSAPTLTSFPTCRTPPSDGGRARSHVGRAISLGLQYGCSKRAGIHSPALSLCTQNIAVCRYFCSGRCWI